MRSVLVLVISAASVAHAIAGPLTPPPGPITSTLKTLHEVEPRTLINPINTPGVGTNLVNIAQPGSYYLGADLVVPSGFAGIVINASDVTIDLNGFSIRGQPGSLDGIRTAGPAKSNLTILNGTIASMGDDGIDFVQSGSATNTRIETLTVSDCGGNGIRLWQAAIVRGCQANGNTLSGIASSGTAIVEATIASSNGEHGILTGADSVVQRCTTSENVQMGIRVGNRSSVLDSAASLNAAGGIFINESSMVDRCLARGNTGFGIRAFAGCVIRNNTSDANTGAPGFLITGPDNRIESNNSTINSRGLQVLSTGNIIIKNTASGNTINWDIAAFNSVAPIVVTPTNAAPISGNSSAGSFTTSDPNTNFTY